MDIEKIIAHQRKFVAEREWEKFHDPKNLAMALAGETGELLEVFQWLTSEESRTIMSDPKKAEMTRHEISDIFYYLVRLTDLLGIDLEKAFWEKMELNARRYPADKARGQAKKYTEL